MRRACKVEERLRLTLTRVVRYVLAFRLATNKDGSRLFAKTLRSSVGGECWWFRTSWRMRSGSASRIWCWWAGSKRSCISVRSEVKIETREQRCFRSRHSKWRRRKKSGCVREYPSAHLCLLEFSWPVHGQLQSRLAKNAGQAGAQNASLQFTRLRADIVLECAISLEYALSSRSGLTK